MADYTIGPDEVAAHFTLTPGEPAIVTFTNEEFEYAESRVEIVARDGGAEVYYTIDGSPPEVGGPNCYVLPAGVVGSDLRAPSQRGRTVVMLLSVGTRAMTVQREL